MESKEVKEVKLHGYWASSDCASVRHALNLKAVAYDYMEVDIDKKSDSILRIYDKVPVLEVDGESITNALVILEFIEETWKDPPLLPKDPCMRARVRFWSDFFYKKVK